MPPTVLSKRTVSCQLSPHSSVACFPESPQEEERGPRPGLSSQHPAKGRSSGRLGSLKGLWPEGPGHQMSRPGKSSRSHFSYGAVRARDRRAARGGLATRCGGWSRSLELRTCDLDPRVPLESFGDQHLPARKWTPALDKGEGWCPQPFMPAGAQLPSAHMQPSPPAALGQVSSSHFSDGEPEETGVGQRFIQGPTGGRGRAGLRLPQECPGRSGCLAAAPREGGEVLPTPQLSAAC